MTRCYSVVAKGGLALIAAALLLDCAALALDIVLGRRIIDGLEVTAENLETSSSLSSAANLAVPAAVLIGGVLFLRWFHCAYRRLAAATPTAYRPIWAIVGWVVPGLNLVRPPKIMAELTTRAGLTGAWWLLWLLGGGVQVALRFIAPETQQGWVNWQATALMANLVLLSSLAFGVVLINLSRRRPFRAPPPLIRSDRGRYPDRYPGRDPGFDPDRAA